MDNFSALIYGLIQGLTEFLPVSSSGHLALMPHLLKIKDPGLVFDLAMHAGTALAIMVYFNKAVKKIFIDLYLSCTQRGHITGNGSHTWNMAISSLATFIVVIILRPLAESYGRDSFLIALNLIIFGLLMYLSDAFKKEHDEVQMNKLNVKNAILIGLSQAMAIFPGVSRSGVTLTMARAIGLGRTEASSYSFLLSLPIIFGGLILKSPDLFRSGAPFDLTSTLIGVAVSFLVGLLTIHFFLKLIKKIGLGVFSLYRLILGLIVYYLLV